MYKSPIEKIYGEIQTQMVQEDEKMVMKAVRNVGVTVDKEELIRALQYDRNQYSKGYADGKAEMREKIDKAVEEIYEECANDMTYNKVTKLHCIAVILRHIGEQA